MYDNNNKNNHNDKVLLQQDREDALPRGNGLSANRMTERGALILAEAAAHIQECKERCWREAHYGAVGPRESWAGHGAL